MIMHDDADQMPDDEWAERIRSALEFYSDVSGEVLSGTPNIDVRIGFRVASTTPPRLINGFGFPKPASPGHMSAHTRMSRAAARERLAPLVRPIANLLSRPFGGRIADLIGWIEIGHRQEAPALAVGLQPRHINIAYQPLRVEVRAAAITGRTRRNIAHVLATKPPPGCNTTWIAYFVGPDDRKLPHYLSIEVLADTPASALRAAAGGLALMRSWDGRPLIADPILLGLRDPASSLVPITIPLIEAQRFEPEGTSVRQILDDQGLLAPLPNHIMGLKAQYEPYRR